VSISLHNIVDLIIQCKIKGQKIDWRVQCAVFNISLKNTDLYNIGTYIIGRLVDTYLS